MTFSKKKRKFLFQQSRKVSDRDKYTSVEFKESFSHHTLPRKWEGQHQKKTRRFEKTSQEHQLWQNYNEKLVDSSKLSG